MFSLFCNYKPLLLFILSSFIAVFKTEGKKFRISFFRSPLLGIFFSPSIFSSLIYAHLFVLKKLPLGWKGIEDSIGVEDCVYILLECQLLL